MSLSNFPILSLLLFICSIVAEAATVTYNFNITWVRANPDGLFERPTIGINGQWPPPIIYATIGDTVIVNVVNQLGNQTTTLHFHGLYMNGTTEMDGALQVSQCAIIPGYSFTYNFTVSSSYACFAWALLRASRSINQAHIGITLTTRGNIQMVFVLRSLYMILTLHLRGSMIRNMSCQSQAGTMTRWRL